MYVEVKDLKKSYGEGGSYRVSGIVVVSDYDAPFKEISDTSCNSKSFGPVFLTKEAYEDFRNSNSAQRSETYLYAYKLGENVTDKDLKDYLKDIKIEADEVDDELFKEYWERTAGVPDKLTEAVSDLKDATEEVRDALSELEENNDDINDGTDTLFAAYLEQTADALKGYGITTELTEDNYESRLSELEDAVPLEAMKEALAEARKQLDELKEFKDGLTEYTDAVIEIGDGTDEMADGVTVCCDHCIIFTDQFTACKKT